MVNLYIEAEDISYPKKNIERGRVHRIWSKVEDLTAYYFSGILEKEDFNFYIDFSISIKNEGKIQIIYPDILIVKNKEILQLWDVKIDLGFHRKLNFDEMNTVTNKIC